MTTEKWPEIDIVDERPINDQSDYRASFDQAKKPIKHVLFSVRQKKDGTNLPIIFDRDEIYYNPADNKKYDDVKNYAMGLVKNPSTPIEGKMVPTPLDFGVSKQTWVVIELDAAINWRFAQGVKACKSKEKDKDTHGDGKKGHNLLLRHVYDRRVEEKTDDGKIDAEPCRIIFFGVAHRGPKYAKHLFNFKVEFFQKDLKTGKDVVLPLVLDPDVGNEGEDSIPPTGP